MMTTMMRMTTKGWGFHYISSPDLFRFVNYLIAASSLLVCLSRVLMSSSKSGISFFSFVWICAFFFFLIFELAAECQFPVIMRRTKFHVQAVGSCRLVTF